VLIMQRRQSRIGSTGMVSPAGTLTTGYRTAADVRRRSDRAAHDATKTADHAKAAIDADAAGHKQATPNATDADKQAIDQQ
jgi:hypothetical protein